MEKKERLLIYSDCYIYGGSERLLSFLILNAYIQEKYEIHFAYRQHKSYEVGLNEDYGSSRENFHPLFLFSNDTLFHKINMSASSGFLKKILKGPFWFCQKIGIYFLYNFLAMFILIKKINPQVIHINNGGYPAAKSCFAFVLAAKSAGINNIFYQVNNMASLSKTKLDRLIDEKIVERFVRYFITASKKARDVLSQNRNFSLDKIISIPNTTPIKSLIGSREKVLKDFSWPEDVFLLCEVAFLSERKGQFFLLEAVKNIKINNPDLFKKLRLVFVGDGEDEIILKKYVKDNNLSSNVFFAGYRSDRLDFIKACDVFVLPSIANEDMPIVILEAMSMSKAIIASNFAGIEEELENGVSGILVKPNKETLSLDLSDAIINIYNTRNTNSFGLNAKTRFDEYFSMEKYAQRLIDIYKLVNN